MTMGGWVQGVPAATSAKKRTLIAERADADILLHVLEPVTAAVIDAAPRLRAAAA